MKIAILCLLISVILLGFSLKSLEGYAQGYKPPARSGEYSYNTYEQSDTTAQQRKVTGFSFNSPNWNFGGPFGSGKV